MSELTDNLYFDANNLASVVLDTVAQERQTGCWQFQLKREHGNLSLAWYLYFSQGHIVFSGPQPLSLRSLLKTLQRYLAPLRTTQAKHTIQALLSETPASERELYGKLLDTIEDVLSIPPQDVVQAIQLQIISDFETYLDLAGLGKFIPDLQSPNQLSLKMSISDFTVETIFSKYLSRKNEWQALQPYIPSMKAIAQLNVAALDQSELSDVQKQQLQKLVQPNQSLQAIAEATAKDSLNVAQKFSTFVRRGLVTLQLPATDANAAPQIFIVDDSLAFLQQIQKLVSTWGYQVQAWSHASSATEKMLEVNPSVIFLDINMPGLSGFDLIKEIRREPRLSALPLVLLTAENSLSNQWRAKWGNCKFLTKPRSRDEISTFQLELKELLQSISPIAVLTV